MKTSKSNRNMSFISLINKSLVVGSITVLMSGQAFGAWFSSSKKEGSPIYQNNPDFVTKMMRVSAHNKAEGLKSDEATLNYANKIAEIKALERELDIAKQAEETAEHQKNNSFNNKHATATGSNKTIRGINRTLFSKPGFWRSKDEKTKYKEQVEFEEGEHQKDKEAHRIAGEKRKEILSKLNDAKREIVKLDSEFRNTNETCKEMNAKGVLTNPTGCVDFIESNIKDAITQEEAVIGTKLQKATENAKLYLTAFRKPSDLKVEGDRHYSEIEAQQKFNLVLKELHEKASPVDDVDKFLSDCISKFAVGCTFTNAAGAATVFSSSELLALRNQLFALQKDLIKKAGPPKELMSADEASTLSFAHQYEALKKAEESLVTMGKRSDEIIENIKNGKSPCLLASGVGDTGVHAKQTENTMKLYSLCFPDGVDIADEACIKYVKANYSSISPFIDHADTVEIKPEGKNLTLMHRTQGKFQFTKGKAFVQMPTAEITRATGLPQAGRAPLIGTNIPGANILTAPGTVSPIKYEAAISDFDKAAVGTLNKDYVLDNF